MTTESFPWISSYPDGVNDTIDSNRFSSIIDLFDQSLKKFASLPAYELMGKTITFNETKMYMDNFAAWIQNNTSLKKGDRIAVQLPNLLQNPVVVFGALQAGLVVVNTNPLYTSEEMKHQFNDLGVKAIVILENFAYNLEKILPQTSIETVIIAKIGDMLGLKGIAVNFAVKHIKKMVPKYYISGAVPFKSIFKKNGKPNLPKLTGDDIAFLQYTGGTTGVSKGAILTHRNITSNMSQIDGWIKGIFEEGKEVFIAALPLYHIFALTANLILGVFIGAKNKMITNPKDLKSFIKTLSNEPFSFLPGVNTLFNGMMNHPDFKLINFSKLRLVLAGGMALQDAVANRWKALTGIQIIEAYGLSETSPGASINPINGNHKQGTIGLPIPSTEFKFFDDDLNEVELGKPGEIAIKGPQVTQGYWNQPEETKKSFHNGFFLTGDIGYMDSDGFTKIIDRKKEMILVSGFNVYPNEIEKIIAEHPKVLEVGVKGLLDEKSSEIVSAYIVKKDITLTEKEIQDFCKDKITAYKIPKVILFRDELPKSNVGKILRRLMK